MAKHRYLMGYQASIDSRTIITGRMTVTLDQPFSPENLDDVEADMLRAAEDSNPGVARVVITSVWKFED